MAIKIFDLHLVEHQQGQMEQCFFPNFFPKEFSCCSYFCWNRLLLNIKGRAQGPDPRSCARAGPLSRDFGGAGSS